MPKKILIFAPATNWIVHHQLDCVVGAALANRGCEVRVIGCDGLFESCLVKGNPPNEAHCETCKHHGKEWFTRFKLPVTQMSALLTTEDRQEVSRWVESIDMSNYGSACFREWEIGKWMLWNLHADLLNGILDFTKEEVRKRARDFALQGAYVALSATRMIEEYKPDRAICYNGTNSYYRVFFELCRKHNIPALIHERGTTKGSFILVDNGTTYQSYIEAPSEWESQWKNTPLTLDQWRKTREFFDAKEEGKNTNFQRMHDFCKETELVRQRLRLKTGSKVLLALGSGDWEFGMSKSYGGLGLVWQTQLEWLQVTAQICAQNGWQLVIRHHPLGAGRKHYPRGIEFLTTLIEHSAQWGDHVRVIMPAENISTYDLMRVCDAGTAQFTSSAAEAVLNGMPMVCVVASAFRYLGMEWVRQSEDYESALVKVMNTEKPLSELALTQAHRFAHFRFFIAGSCSFSSFQIKNVYEPDFLLETPDELLPGVDPALDRVCEYMLNGTPLHPPPNGIPNPEEESLQIQEYRRQLIELRDSLQKIVPPASYPSVTVWRLGGSREHVKGQAPAPEGWRSRHTEIAFDWLPLDASGGMEAVRLTLAAKARDTDSPYVYLHSPHTTLDESVLARAVDALELPSNKDKTGVLFGCYLLDEDGKVGPEWNTALKEAVSDDLPPVLIPPLSQPLIALGIVIWRRDKLIEWLDSIQNEKADISPELLRGYLDTGSLWHKEKLMSWLEAKQTGELKCCEEILLSFLNTDNFVNISEPAVYIQDQPTSAQLLAGAEAEASEGKLDIALKKAAEIQARFGDAPGLRAAMARWLFDAGRVTEARPLLYADYHERHGDKSSWSMLEKVHLALAGKAPSYEDCALAVDTVEGYMCPGQEQYLHDKVLSLPQNARILELGACFGRSTAAMAYACVGTKRRVLSIDTFSGNDGFMGRVAWRYHTWRGNMRRWGLEHYASAIAGYTHPELRKMPEEEVFDFAFIDASHEYTDVLLDFELVYARTKPGGWIAFHDVTPGWPGSWRVWEQTAKRLLVNHEIETTLACGQKQPGVPWKTYEETWPGYAAYYGRHLTESVDTREEGEAMLSLINSATAEQRLAKAAPHVRQALDDMLTQEAREDPWVHYIAALTQKEVNPKFAENHLAEAKRLGVSKPIESRP